MGSAIHVGPPPLGADVLQALPVATSGSPRRPRERSLLMQVNPTVICRGIPESAIFRLRSPRFRALELGTTAPKRLLISLRYENE